MDKYRSTVLNSLKFRFWLFLKMPIALIAGMRIRELDRNSCRTSIPYKWLSQNPFRSIYFATQAMAAELSTGALAMLSIQGLDPSVAMLVVGMEAEYTKKASSRVYFTCEQGDRIFAAVDRCLTTGEGEAVTVETVGRLEDGSEVSRFRFTWSFKRRDRR
jgi:hypothetical protein